MATINLRTLMLITLILTTLASICRSGFRREALQAAEFRALPFNLLVTAVWVAGWMSIGAFPRFMDIIHFLGPGIIIFFLLSFGDTMLMMRTSMTDTLFEEYIFAARAKGLPERDITRSPCITQRDLAVCSGNPPNNSHPDPVIWHGDD